MKDHTKLGVLLPNALHTQLKVFCVEHNIQMNNFVRWLIEKALQKKGKK